MPQQVTIPPLQKAYLAFCNFGKGSAEMVYDMDSKAFAKMARDCGLLSKQCTPTDIDLFFTKVKEKGERKINFRQFEDGVGMIAEKKGKTVELVIKKIIETGGPLINNATEAQPVKWHDDKSTYTGVYKNGGPTNYEGNQDLSALLDRSPSDVRGRGNMSNFRKTPGAHKPLASFGILHEKREARQHWGALRNAVATVSLLKKAAEKGAKPRQDPQEERDVLKEAFLKFASYGKGSAFILDIDATNFRKLCRDCGLVSGPLTEVEVDMIFTTAKIKGTRRMDYVQFVQSLQLIADKLQKPLAEVTDAVVMSGGPISYATQAEYVPFHDDKQLYTGVKKYGDLSSSQPSAGPESGSQPRIRPPSGTKAPPQQISRPGSRQQQRPLQVGDPALYEAFLEFANYGKGSAGQQRVMDNKNFQKLVKDCGLLGRDLSMTDADLVFTRAKEKAQRIITYEQFLSALALVAEKKGKPMGKITSLITAVQGPTSSGTKTQYSKFNPKPW